MTETILLVGHGSRDSNGNKEIDKFAEKWKAMNPDWRIEVCFIEFADVLLDEGFDNAAKDATRVFVIPLILNAAGHVKMEIPEHLAKARQRHSGVEFIYGKHLGVSMEILTVIKRSLTQTLALMAMPDPKTTGVIILGRGSSDKLANGEVAKLARWLQEETGHEIVDIAFTGITYPRLETVVQRTSENRDDANCHFAILLVYRHINYAHCGTTCAFAKTVSAHTFCLG